MNNYFEPREILVTLLRRGWVLILGTAIAVALGYNITQNQTPVYRASVTIMVGDFTQVAQLSRDEIATRDTLIKAYAEMALRQPVLEAVVNALDLDYSWKHLQDLIIIEFVEGTPLFEIKAEADSPQAAQAITGEIANQLILLSQPQPRADEDGTRQFVLQELETLQARIQTARKRLTALQTQITQPVSSERLNELRSEIDTVERFITDWEDTYARLLPLIEPNVSQNSLTILEEARAIPDPISPHLSLNLLLSAGIGFVLALGAVFLMGLFDNKIRTSKVLEQKLGLRHLGTINKMSGKDYDGKLVAAQDPLFGTAVFYRQILNNIGFNEKGAQPVKSLLVTSPRLREGKSVTVSNLAIMMAQAGLKTIIVDVDWKEPVQHQLFGLPNGFGLMDLLETPTLSTNEHLQLTSIPNLQILTSGRLPDNPAEMVEPERMRQILSDLGKVSDMVILDSPSAVITESAVLFELVDGVVLVIDSDRTTMSSAKQAMTSLYLTGGRLLGGILNRTPSYWGLS